MRMARDCSRSSPICILLLEGGAMVQERSIFRAAKRCGIRQCEWMKNGDWFISWSPRNDNSNSEGTWAHWVNLARFILSHPATEIVDKEAYIPELKADISMYTGGALLSEEQVKELFPSC